MLSKKLSKLILIGGIGALINSFVYTLRPNDYNIFFEFFAPVFYFIHSFITILAGYFLLKQKKLGVRLLIISFFLFVLALFIPAPGIGSLFLTTIILSIFAALIPTALFVPVFTGIFLFSVCRGSVKILKINFKKNSIEKNSNF